MNKGIHRCTSCILKTSLRQLNSDASNAVNSQKIETKSVILTQWKLMNQLKNQLSNYLNAKSVETVLNQEFVKFLEKIQPTISTIDLWKYVNSLQLPNFKNEGTITKIAQSNNKIEESKKTNWKNAALSISKESITSRTEQLLSLISTAQTEQSILNRLEDFNDHLKKYPEAKHMAVKQHAIRLILKLKQRLLHNENAGAINETLALLGYAPRVPGKGVRILSIDGGGVRGVLVIEMLKKLEELTGKRIHEMFDLICGVSTGAIVASLLGIKQSTLDEILEIYKDLSTQIFTQSAFKGTSSLVWSHSYYDTARWEQMLKDQIGDQALINTSRNPKCPKLCFLSAVVNHSRLSAYVFRNYALPCHLQSQYMGSHKHLIWEAVRASAAAPTYFEEFKLGSLLHQDGGILFNNPTAVAVHEARLLWPETPIQCILSFGTGRTVPLPVDPNDKQIINTSSWKSKFYAIIESATDTEGVHTMLSDLLPEHIYYRFNPYLTEMLDIAEIDPKKLEQLKRDAIMYLRRNEDKFQEAAKVLNYEKSFSQKTVDWINLQREIHGFKMLL